MKRTGSFKILLSAILALTAAGLLYAAPHRDSWDDEARRRKASYLYLQALDAFMDERYNLYGELLTRAYQLDPDDSELVTRYGEWLLLTNSSDSIAIERGFDMMLGGYKRHPADYFEGLQLLNLTTNYRRWNDNLTVSKILHEQFPERNEVSLQLGRSYLMHALMGDTSYVTPAIKLFAGLEDKVGKSPLLSELKIRAFAINRDTAAIIRELDDLNASSPADPYTALSIGQIYSSLSKPDSALTYFNRACELDSANGTAIMLRAQLYQQQGDSVTFDREAFRAIKSQDLELDTKLKLIVNYVNMLYNDSTQHRRIDNLFETLLDVNPGEPQIHRLYAGYLAQTGKADKAADQMGYAVALDGTDRDGWLFLAQLYSDMKDYGQAAKALDDASKYFPKDYQFVRARSLFHSLSDDTPTAIKILEEYPDTLLADPTDRSEHQAMLGDYFYKLKDRDNAFEAYEKALKTNPFNYMAMNNVAYYYAETDTLLDKAETYSARTLRHEPDNTTYLDTYAWVLYKKGDYQKAKEQIDRTLKLVCSEEAVDSSDTALDNSETDIVTAVNGNEVSEGTPDVIDAAPDLLGSAELFDHAGDIYYRCGNVVQAVEYWTMALARNPENKAEIQTKIKHRKIIDNEP